MTLTVICAGRPQQARRIEHFSAGFEIASHFTGKPTIHPVISSHSPETKRVTRLVSGATDEPQGRHLLGNYRSLPPGPNLFGRFFSVSALLIKQFGRLSRQFAS
jgi:hypothetical protein